MGEPFSMESGVTGQRGAFYQKYNPFPSRPCPQYLVLFLKDPEPASASCTGLFLNTFPKADILLFMYLKEYSEGGFLTRVGYGQSNS